MYLQKKVFWTLPFFLILSACYTTQKVYRSTPEIDKNTSVYLGSSLKIKPIVSDSLITFRFYIEERYKANAIVEVVKEKILDQQAMRMIAEFGMLAADAAMAERARIKNDDKKKDKDTTTEDIVAAAGMATALSSSIVSSKAGPRMVTKTESTIAYYTEEVLLNSSSIPLKIQSPSGSHIGTVFQSEYSINPITEWNENLSEAPYKISFSFKYQGEQYFQEIIIPTTELRKLIYKNAHY